VFNDEKLAREPRPYAPCLVLGTVKAEGPRRISYYRAHDGLLIFITRHWGVHTVPCPQCEDAS